MFIRITREAILLQNYLPDMARWELCAFNTGLLVTEALPNHLTLDDLHEFFAPFDSFSASHDYW